MFFVTDTYPLHQLLQHVIYVFFRFYQKLIVCCLDFLNLITAYHIFFPFRVMATLSGRISSFVERYHQKIFCLFRILSIFHSSVNRCFAYFYEHLSASAMKLVCLSKLLKKNEITWFPIISGTLHQTRIDLKRQLRGKPLT